MDFFWKYEYDSQNFFHTTHRIELVFSNMTFFLQWTFLKYDSKNWNSPIRLRGFNFFLWYDSKVLNFFFCMTLSELNFFSRNITWLIELNLFLWTSFQYDSKSWIFFESDFNFWTFFLNWTQRIEPLFWVWLKDFFVYRVYLQIQKILCNMATTKTTTTWAMRSSVRPTTASTTTTRVTCSTSYTELAHSAHSLMSSHTSLAQDLSLVIDISTVIQERTSLSRFSSSISTCPFLSSSFPSTSCTASCTLSSTTWSPCKTCATLPTRGVTTPTTSPPPSQVYEPNVMAFSELNDFIGFLLLHYPVIGPGHGWRDTRQAAHRGTPRTSRLLRTRRRVVSQSSSSVVFDGSGKPDGERNVDQSVGFGVTRNTYSAHSKFSENTQAEKEVDGSGKLDERSSSNAQIGTLLEEQRQMIVAEYYEKIGHHELQAALAEEERRLLPEELWRQKLEFLEVHQQSLTEMEELREFQSSTYDTLARRKLIEDQNTILKIIRQSTRTTKWC